MDGQKLGNLSVFKQCAQNGFFKQLIKRIFGQLWKFIVGKREFIKQRFFEWLRRLVRRFERIGQFKYIERKFVKQRFLGQFRFGILKYFEFVRRFEHVERKFVRRLE